MPLYSSVLRSKMELERREVVYSGYVQGVGFRYNAQRIVTRTELTGFVKNLNDGRVQLVLEGRTDEINAAMATIRQSMEGNIENVESTTTEYLGEYGEFQIRRG